VRSIGVREGYSTGDGRADPSFSIFLSILVHIFPDRSLAEEGLTVARAVVRRRT
jgi:hypothetical protein